MPGRKKIEGRVYSPNWGGNRKGRGKVVGRPKKANPQRSAVDILLEDDLETSLRDYCIYRQVSLSFVIAEALKEYVEARLHGLILPRAKTGKSARPISRRNRHKIRIYLDQGSYEEISGYCLRTNSTIALIASRSLESYLKERT